MGSNEGPSAEIMGAALHKLSLMPLLSIGKVSSLYKTPPWGKTDQAEFLNAVIEADWQDTPEGLLEVLKDKEKAFGRRRMVRWGPRTLDLDLLYDEGYQIPQGSVTFHRSKQLHQWKISGRHFL